MTQADKQTLSDLLTILKNSPTTINKETANKIMQVTMNQLTSQIQAKTTDLSVLQVGNTAAAVIQAR
jgi:hypothetical protein